MNTPTRQTDATGTGGTRETVTLIAANRVEGTNVYDHEGNKLGSIDTLMIDKSSGQVSYAVLSFGGFLGFGESHYPLPWQQMHYDQRQDGYVVGITEAQLKGAPHYGQQETANWNDTGWRGSIDDYYGAGRAGGATTPGTSSALGGSLRHT